MKSKSSWELYYQNTKGRPPRQELVNALKFVTNKDVAIDLGAGALQDSYYLLKQGFREVVAVDSEPTVQGKSSDERVHIVISTFEDFDFPIDSIDLINAQYSLPFTNPEEFERVFTAVKNSLRTGGLFVGQLFGDRDGWSQNNDMTFLTKDEVLNVICDMEVITFLETEVDKKTASGVNKHWHVFNVVLRKK